MLTKLHKLKNTMNKRLVQSSFTVKCFMKLRKLYSNVDDFVKKILNKKPVLYLFEYHVVEHCNMNCKSCFHFSNLVKQPKFADFEQYTRDLRRLSEQFSNVRVIHLMGGEPLLNPELPQFIHVTRHFFPKATICILTNGMLVKKMAPELMKAIVKHNVRFRVSIYEPMIKRREEVASFLAQHGIKHWVSDPYLSFAKYINIEGNSNPKKSVGQCPASRCTFVSNGRMARCALPFNMKYFNRHFDKQIDMRSDQLDFHDSDVDGFQIKKHLLKPMSACRYCKEVEWISWKRSVRADRSDATLNDFCSNA